MKEFSSDFDKFEKSVMEKLLDGDDVFLSILRKQYENSTIKKREYTGHGFYTYFSIPDDIPKLDDKKMQFGDVEAEIEGISDGVGFVLFITNGKIDFLEGYTYGENFPRNIVRYKLSYVDGEKRNLNKLKRKFL